MPATYEPISSITTTGTVASVTFSSIPQTYTDLILIAWVADGVSSTTLNLRFNGDSGTNYSRQLFTTVNTAVRNTGVTSANIGQVDNTAWAPNIFDINGYTSGLVKTIFCRSYSRSVNGRIAVSKWNNTAAINTIEAISTGSNIASGSMFTLYGIKAA